VIVLKSGIDAGDLHTDRIVGDDVAGPIFDW